MAGTLDAIRKTITGWSDETLEQAVRNALGGTDRVRSGPSPERGERYRLAEVEVSAGVVANRPTYTVNLEQI